MQISKIQVRQHICQERGQEVIRVEIDWPVGKDQSVLPYSSDNSESERSKN